MDSVALLRQLRTDYAEKKISALVGAGFSKNALPTFPLWQDLLLPLVQETYTQEFDNLLKYYTRQAKKNEESHTECLRHTCNDILLKYGNLEVVSEYIRRKGIGHEAIDAYIEQYIKPAETKGDKWVYDGKTYTSNILQTHMELLQCTYFRHIYTTNYDNLLETAQQLNSAIERLKIVTDEVGLSDLSMSRAIVKLHGDIRRSAEDEYAFDGDRNLRYIIAKEDYDTYMQKHQGFSYLMRIEMLQGRFCLLGFSGSDPNYMMWLQWMKEILDKEQHRFERFTNTSDVKVYIVLPYAASLSPATALFYKNHHVGIIDLTDSMVINEMQSAVSESVRSSHKVVTSTTSPADLLQLFFRYLQISQHERTTPNYPSLSEGYSEKYISAWRGIDDAITNNRDTGKSVKLVEEYYNASQIPINTSWQDSLSHHLLHMKEPWDKTAAHIFALAVRDKGSFPSYYRSVITDSDNSILQDELWKSLVQKESIFQSPDTVLPESASSLLRIMARAYSLDFEQMYDSLNSWKPTAQELPKKWMLMSLFNQREEFLSYLDALIDKTDDDLNRMNLSIMRNIQSRDWPQRYDIRPFTKKGLKSTIDCIQHVSQTVSGKQTKKERHPYGVVTTSFSWERGDAEYEGSMRIISLLCDNAYVPNYYSISLIRPENWYDVFSQLYVQYPYPVLYYSLYLTDENILRRIGQDVAYSETLYPLLSDILNRMLRTLTDKHHPAIVERGVLIISSELYVSVPDCQWYTAFKECVFDIFCTEILPGKYVRDSWTPNVRAALQNIKSAEHVNELFILLMALFDKNPKVVSSLCVGYLQLENLSVKDDRVRSVINNIVIQGSLLEYSEILYALTFYKKLTPEHSVMVSQKIDNDNLFFCLHDNNHLFQLAYLAQTEKQKDVIKKLILQIPDLWNCGISKKSRTNPSPFPLLAMPDTIRWTSEEMDKIVKNMAGNLDKIGAIKLRDEDFWRGSYLKLIGDMIHFIIIHRNAGYDFTSIKHTVQYVISKLTGTTAAKELFYSQDYFTLNLGYYMLTADMFGDITQKDRACIDVLITRIMMLDKSSFQTLVSIICGILTEFTDFMVAEYKDALLSLLRIGKGISYKDLELDLASTNASFIRIAELLHKQGVRDSSVDVWLTEKMLRRFTLRIA